MSDLLEALRTPVCDRLIDLKEVRRQTSLSVSSIYRLKSANKFPQPTKLNGDLVRWSENEVQRWIADRLAERERG